MSLVKLLSLSLFAVAANAQDFVRPQFPGQVAPRQNYYPTQPPPRVGQFPNQFPGQPQFPGQHQHPGQRPGQQFPGSQFPGQHPGHGGYPRPPIVGLPAPRPPVYQPPVVHPPIVRPPVIRPPVILPPQGQSYELVCFANREGNHSGFDRIRLQIDRTGFNTFHIDGYVRYVNGAQNRVHADATGEINRGTVHLKMGRTGYIDLHPTRRGFNSDLMGEISLFGALDGNGMVCEIDRD